LTAPNTIDRARRAAAKCRATGDPDVVWLGSAIGGALDERAAGGFVTLDDVLGLSKPALLGYRDDRLREAHKKHFASLSLRGVAKEIRRQVRRLRRAKLELEQIAADDPRRPIAEALATGLDIPGERQLINILGVKRAREIGTVGIAQLAPEASVTPEF